MKPGSCTQMMILAFSFNKRYMR